MAAGVAFGTVAAGGLCALALRCVGNRSRNVLLCLLLVPLFIPPYVMGLAWPRLGSFLGWNIAGVWWTIALLTACYFPLLMALIIAGLNTVSQPLIDAARLRWGWLGTWYYLVLPLVGRNIAIGFLLVFLLALGEYGLASVLQVQTFPIEIMTEFSAFYDEGAAARLCVPLLFAGLVALIALESVIGKRYARVIPRRSTSFEWTIGPVLSGLALAVLLGIFVVAVLVPIVMLLDGLEGWQSFRRAWDTAHEQLIRSFLLCALCTGAAILLAWPLARMQLRTSGAAKRTIDMLTLLPLAIPGSIVGVGFIFVWNRPYLDWVTDCWLIMPMLLLARFFPLAQKSLVVAFGMVHESLWASAVLAPRRKMARLIQIEIPLVKRGMFVAALSVFVLAFRELSATVLVTPPGCETLALRTYTLSHYGADDLIMALCLMSIGVAITGYILALMVLKRR